ncbi:TPA: hypothetical protein ACNVDX_003153 [Citrobacter gillenii]
MTTNHPAHGPVSLDRLHQIREILSKAAAQSDGGNLGYAMADAVNVIDVAIAAFDAEPNYGIHRDANRYRFLRDKDAFGDEGEPGLASWDDLAELDTGDFDSAVDARILSCEMPQHILTKAQEMAATAGVYAELYRLREEVKGPAGFDTWKDAAIAERKARVELEKAIPILNDIDYLGAMAAFHSDEWHKMGPITGYMHGWNRCRAAMLRAGNSPVIGIDLASEPDRSVEVRHFAPPGYVMVPVEPTMAMLDEFDSIIDYGAEDSKDAWSRLIAAAPQQEVK